MQQNCRSHFYSDLDLADLHLLTNLGILPVLLTAGVYLMIQSFRRLSTKALLDLETLAADCQRIDKQPIPLYQRLLCQERSQESLLLAYRGTHLQGFLGAFFFEPGEVEISLLVTPEHRRQGLAGQLFQQILPLILQQGCTRCVFSAVHAGPESWLRQKGLHFLHSEYQLVLGEEPCLQLAMASRPLIRRAQLSDIPALIAIEQACFNSDAALEDYYYSRLQNPRYQILVAQQEAQLCGKMHLIFSSNAVELSNIAVLPEYQGQGFASCLIQTAIKDIRIDSNPSICLSVEAQNSKALQLYQRLGFDCNAAWDYWRLELASATNP